MHFSEFSIKQPPLADAVRPDPLAISCRQIFLKRPCNFVPVWFRVRIWCANALSTKLHCVNCVRQRRQILGRKFLQNISSLDLNPKVLAFSDCDDTGCGYPL
jgi:hypothetical protein